MQLHRYHPTQLFSLALSVFLLALLTVPTALLAQERAQTLTEEVARIGGSALMPTAESARVIENQPPVRKVQTVTFYTDEAAFDAAFPMLTDEDFEDSNVTPGGILGCPAPADTNSNNACFDPGDIEPGLSFEDAGPGAPSPDPIDGLVAVGVGFAGAPSSVIAANTFIDRFVMDFTGPDDVGAVGMDIVNFQGSTTCTVDVFGAGGLLASTTTSCSAGGNFFGISSDMDPITSVEITGGGDGAEGIDNLRFGEGLPEADLALTKDCEAGGNSASFHVTVYNDGPDDATGVWVQDNLPGAILITNYSASQGTFDPFSGAWDVGDIAYGASAELAIYVDLQGEGRYTNEAYISAANEDDPDPYNNDDYCSFVKTGDRVVPDFVPGQSAGGIVERGSRFTADLELTKEVDTDEAGAGATVQYTIDVTNLGPQSTAKVEATDNLPECLTFVSASASKGSFNETTGVWSIGAMKIDETATLTIDAEVGAACEGEVVNTAYISSSSLPDPSDFFNLFDEPPATANNTDNAMFTVSSSRELVLDGTTFALGTNYPNPFNPTTRIPFSLAESGQVSVRVYDLLGREVSVLVDGSLSAGVHEVEFEGSALPTGMYIVRMEAAGVVKTMRMTLMK